MLLPLHLTVRLLLSISVLIGLSGCATQIVSFEARGYEYDLWFKSAYLDGSKVILVAPPGPQRGSYQFKGHHAVVDLKTLRWYPASVKSDDIPIHRALEFHRSLPETGSSEVQCIDLTPGQACGHDATTNVLVTQADGTSTRFRLSLSRGASGDVKTVITIRATTADGSTTLSSKVAPERGGGAWARLLYPLALAADALSLPFVVFASIAGSH